MTGADMRHRWDGLYPPGAGASEGDDDTTYRRAAAWLDHEGWVVEDWGGGKGWARQFFAHARYRVIDGSMPSSKSGDVLRADLQTYRSRVDGILLRHVLEHNHNWLRILENAKGSARHRLVLVIFTPFSSGPTRQIATNWQEIPDLSFNKEELLAPLAGWKVVGETYQTRTQYRLETVLFAEKPE